MVVEHEGQTSTDKSETDGDNPESDFTVSSPQNSGIEDNSEEETTPSTNDWAKQMIHQQAGQVAPNDLNRSCPKLVLTSIQTSGRGQNSRTWWSGQGSLTFSLIETMPEKSLPLTTGLATALALTEVVNEVAKNMKARIKWPNDVYLNERKIAGILVESVHRAEVSFQVVGVGINVNNVSRDLPAEIRTSATSLAEWTGQQHDLTGFLVRWLEHYFAAQNLRQTDSQQLIATCLDRSQIALGQTITLSLPEGSKVHGKFSGLSERGGILLNQSNQQREFLSATVNSNVD